MNLIKITLYIFLLFSKTTNSKSKNKNPLFTKFKLIGDFMKYRAKFPKLPKVAWLSEIEDIFNNKLDCVEQKRIKTTKEISNKWIPNKKLTDFEIKDLFKELKTNTKSFFDELEEKVRLKHFKKHLNKIIAHNKGNSTYKMGVNQFALLSDEEFRAGKMLPLKIKLPPKNPERHLDSKKSIDKILASLPATINWKKAKKTSPVKNQFNCNSCYAFSTIAALESATMIALNTTLVYSEQEILDCSSDFGNQGCEGGQPSIVFEYVLSKGINLQSNYPLMPQSSAGNQTCFDNLNKPIFKRLLNYTFPGQNVISLLQNLQIGPIVVNHFVPDEFKYFISGIFDSVDCFHQAQIDHSSLLVGYNFNNDPPYFLLKNSYGQKWGESGYYKVPIGDLNYDNPGFCYLASNGYNIVPVVG